MPFCEAILSSTCSRKVVMLPVHIPYFYPFGPKGFNIGGRLMVELCIRYQVKAGRHNMGIFRDLHRSVLRVRSNHLCGEEQKCFEIHSRPNEQSPSSVHWLA